ncbi:MAG: 6,7-dimethyl-8-ribityllumazine synthase, partial [Burkholderiales bacterium]
MNQMQTNLNGHGLRIGVVQGRFNNEVGEGLLASCVVELKKLGVQDDAITVATVPGALEIPLTLQRMAQSKKYDALIALGAVIRGDTYHFEIVSNESAAGITQV